MSRIQRPRRRNLVALACCFALVGGLTNASWGASSVPAEECSAADRGLPSQQALYGYNKTMADFGPRPTGAAAHKQFVNWLESRTKRLPGMRMDSVPYDFRRWESTGADVRLAGRQLRVAAPIPYSRGTAARGVTAPLVHVPTGQAIDAGQRGKIIVRDFPPVSIPAAAFAALEWWEHDPDLTLTKQVLSNYTREWLSGQAQVDLKAAEKAGAAGLVFVHELPTSQVAGFYSPYGGERWRIPAVRVGADEGHALKAAATSGVAATLRSTTRETPDTTRALVATLPGLSDERLVVTSHTDGMNAVWDNGPVAMVAMAEHFVALPAQCRPRTVQFIFTTGHLFMGLQCPSGHRGPSALCAAEELDEDYAKGSVAAVMAIEHLGARNFEAVARPAGQPGKTLEPTGLSEANSFFFGESPALSQAVLSAVVTDDLKATIALRGAELPGPHIPMHHSFGGEGGAYHAHLMPTIAFVTGSRALFGTGYSLEQLVDPALLHLQTRVFVDILHNLESLPREVLAGGYLPQRMARDAMCDSGVAPAGVAECREEAGSGNVPPQWLNLLDRFSHVY